MCHIRLQISSKTKLNLSQRIFFLIYLSRDAAPSSPHNSLSSISCYSNNNNNINVKCSNDLNTEKYSFQSKTIER
jgi:hypothetical protein